MNSYEIDSDDYVASIHTNVIHNNFWILQPLPKSIKAGEVYSFLIGGIFYEKKEKYKERLMKYFFTRDYNMLLNKKTGNLES